MTNKSTKKNSETKNEIEHIKDLFLKLTQNFSLESIISGMFNMKSNDIMVKAIIQTFLKEVDLLTLTNFLYEFKQKEQSPGKAVDNSFLLKRKKKMDKSGGGTQKKKQKLKKLFLVQKERINFTHLLYRLNGEIFFLKPMKNQDDLVELRCADPGCRGYFQYNISTKILEIFFDHTKKYGPHNFECKNCKNYLSQNNFILQSSELIGAEIVKNDGNFYIKDTIKKVKFISSDKDEFINIDEIYKKNVEAIEKFNFSLNENPLKKKVPEDNIIIQTVKNNLEDPKYISSNMFTKGNDKYDNAYKGILDLFWNEKNESVINFQGIENALGGMCKKKDDY